MTGGRPSSPRAKYNGLKVAGIVGMLLFALPTFLLDPWFAPMILVCGLGSHALARRVRCPGCGRRVGWSEGKRFLGIRSRQWLLRIDRTCPECGCDLSQ